MDGSKLSRREFVKVSGAGAAAMARLPVLDGAPKRMPERPLGGPATTSGCSAWVARPPSRSRARATQSLAIINRAIDLGVNYIDTAAAYGRGISQTYIGEVMATRRKEVFLASKTQDRTRDGSLRAARGEPAGRCRPITSTCGSSTTCASTSRSSRSSARTAPSRRSSGARPEDGALPRHHRALRPRRAGAGARSLPVRHGADGLNPADRHRLSFIDGCCRWRTRRPWA